MTLSKKQTALLHVAKAKLGMSDATYQLVLVNLTGVTSSTDLDQAGFEIVMGFFEWQGFAPLTQRGPNYGDRPGMASFAQIQLIRALWSEWTRGQGDEAGLNTWLERYFKASSLRFVKKGDAERVITALKAMKSRAA